MKQHQRLLVILFALCIGIANVWAETATYTVSSKTAVTTSGTAPTGSSASYSQTYNTVSQITNGNSATLTLSGFAGQKVTGIVLSMKSNGSKGTGTFSAVAGSTTIASIASATAFNKWYDNTSYGTTYRDVTVVLTNNDYAIQTGENVVIKIAATVNSLYIQSYTITYESTGSGSSCTKPTTFTIENKTISLEEASAADYDLSALTTNKGGSTGAITYACDDASVMIDGSTFYTETPGTYTITAAMAANDTYCEATTTFTITVQSAPCTKLDAPTGLNASATAYDAATLTWNAVENATKYQITTTPPPIFGSSTTRETSETTYAATGLSPETTYTWTVKAIGNGTAYCDSEESAESTFTTPAKPKYTITWSTPVGTSTTTVPQGDKIGTLHADPAAPIGCSDKVFMGWSATNIGTTGTDNAPEFITAETVPAGDVTYYAVFATKTTVVGGEEVKSQTLAYDTWNYSGTTDNKTTYRLFGKDSYIESAQFDLSTLAKVIVYGGTFGGGSYNSISILGVVNNTSTKWKDGTVSGSSQTGSNTFTSETTLSGNGTLRIMSNSGNGSNQGIRISKVEIYTQGATTTYTDYVTNCVDCTTPATPLALSVTETTLNLGEDGTATTTFSTTGGNGGTIDYAVNPTAGATLDKDNKTITFNAAGTYTLTASQDLNTTNGTTYCGSRVSQTVTITKNPVFETATIDKSSFEVNCGDTTSMNSAAVITLGTNYNLSKSITIIAPEGFLVSTNKTDKTKYTASVTLTPAASGDNIGKITAKVYVRAYSAIARADGYTGDITISGDEITLQKMAVSSTVTCTEYTLTLNDRGSKSNGGSYYAGASVLKPADPTGVCTEPINYVFDGWATAEVANGSTTYTPISFPYTMPKGNTTLYAVYKYAEGEGVSKASAADIVDGGKYYITATYSGTEYILKAGQFSTGGSGSYTDAFEEETATEDMAWTFVQSTDSWSIQSNGSKLGTSNDNNGLSSSTSNSGTWSIEATTASSTTVQLTYSSYSRKLALYQNTNWRTYTSSSGVQAIQLYSATSYKYTSSPVCGPYVKITANKQLYVTAGNANGTRCAVQAQDTVKFEAGNLKGNNGAPDIKIPANDITLNGTPVTTVTATIEQTPTDNGDGTYNVQGTIVLTYKPDKFNVYEDVILQLRADYNTSDDVVLDVITLHARSLPEKFVIVAKDNDWYALNADMTRSSAQPAADKVVVDETTNVATIAPCNTLYTFDAMPNVGDKRYVRFVGTEGKYLWAASADNVGIQNYAGTTPSASTLAYNWLLSTQDNKTYTFRNAQNERNLRLNEQKFAMYMQGVNQFYIMEVEDTCIFNYAPTNLHAENVKSAEATLVWEPVAGASMYQVSSDGSTWNDASSAPSYAITGLTPNTSYTYYVRAYHGNAVNSDKICSEVAEVSFSTTDCDDVPYNISYIAELTSVVLSWTATATTATVNLYSDDQGTNLIKSYTGVSSPCTIDGLEKGATYYVQILSGGTCAAAIHEVQTESPMLDVVEWGNDYINVDVNTNEQISVILENQVTKGTGTGIVADELFFSKYYEATGNVKLLAVYNGTGKTIDISDYKIKYGQTSWEKGYILIGEFSATPNEMAPGEEIILYSSQGAQQDSKIMTCVEASYPDAPWKLVTAANNTGGGILQFGGDKTIALFKGDVLIDVIGAVDATGDPCKASDRPSWGDSQGWVCDSGISIEDGSVIGISTNRCLLVRKNTVRSGAEAVAKNTSDFLTLCDEWTGKQIPKSDSDNGVQASCDGFGYVGDFDYTGYYTTYDSLTTTTFDATDRNADGTYTVSVPRMDTLSCRGLKVIVSDKDGKTLTQREYKVPIIVNVDATTANSSLFHFSEDTCKVCDVLIRDNATLSVADGGKNTVRDVMVYQGSTLTVPQGTEYTANSISLRRREQGTDDAVAALDCQGSLNLTRTGDKAVYLDLLISANNWHFLSLPYDCAISEVTFSNGEPAHYGIDWFLMTYDGETRAATQQTGNNWKPYNDATITTGKGYVVGIKGNTAKPNYISELRFPMSRTVLEEESSDKAVSVNAWGANTEARPNHKGWNLIGNPYLNYYKKEGTDAMQGLVSGFLVYDDETGFWDLDQEGERNHPYIVIPQSFGWAAYSQVLTSQTPLAPFTSYFVQITGDNAGESRDIAFMAAQRGRSAIQAKNRQPKTQPVIVALELRNEAGETDVTSLVIDSLFTDEYEMDADFFKWFGDKYREYTLPVVYTIGADGGKRAFNALSEIAAAQPVPVGFFAAQDGEYTFSLNRQTNLGRIAQVWLYDARTAVHTNLLQQDYTFTSEPTEGTGRFSINVRLLPNASTGEDNLADNSLRITAAHRSITVCGLPQHAMVYLYDATGKLIAAENTEAWQRTYNVPQAGTYFVRVLTETGANTLSAIVK